MQGINITYICCPLALAFAMEIAQAAKAFSSKESSRLEESVSYDIQRASKKDAFQGKVSEMVSDDALTQKATKKLINELREKLLERLLSRCMKEFADCREEETKVMNANSGKVRSYAIQDKSALKMSIHKSVMVNATVKSNVVGYIPRKKIENAEGIHEITVEKITYELEKPEKRQENITTVKPTKLKEDQQKSARRKNSEKKPRVLPLEVKKIDLK